MHFLLAAGSETRGLHKFRLLATTAVMLSLPAGAYAQITDTVTESVQTSEQVTSGDTLEIRSNGTITVLDGPALVVNSNANVLNEGTLEVEGETGIGAQLLGGASGDFTVTSSGEIDLSTELDDDDETIDGLNRIGVQVIRDQNGALSAETYSGNVTLESGSVVDVTGTGARGIQVLTDLAGSLLFDGLVQVTGENPETVLVDPDDQTSARISLEETGENAIGLEVDAPVSGDVIIGSTGAIIVTGTDAVGVSIQDNVGGQFRNAGSISLTAETGSNADFNDVADPITKAAVEIGASLGGGFLNDGVSSNTDTSATSAIAALRTGTGVIISPTVSDGTAGDIVIGRAGSDESEAGQEAAVAAAIAAGDTDAVVTGFDYNNDDEIDTDDDGNPTEFGVNDAFGVLNYGTIDIRSNDEGVAVESFRVEGADIDGQVFTTTIEDGIKNAGTIAAEAEDATATAVVIGANATVPTVLNEGSLTSETFGDTGGTATALLIEDGATISNLNAAGETITSIENTGQIAAAAIGENAAAYAIRDESGTITSILNNGDISAASASTIDDVVAEAVAIDLSRAPAFLESGDPNIVTITNAADIRGDVRLGASSDTLLLTNRYDPDPDDDVEPSQKSTLIGDVSFGDGDDTFTIEGDSEFIGGVQKGAGRLDTTVNNSAVWLRQGDQFNTTTFDVSNESRVLIDLGNDNRSIPIINVADTASLAGDTTVELQFVEFVSDETTYELIRSGALTVDQSVFEDQLETLSWFYETDVRTTETGAFYDVRPKTPDELGLNQNQTAAFASVTDALRADEELGAALVNISSADAFRVAYTELLPDIGRGARTIAIGLTDQTTSTVSKRVSAVRAVSDTRQKQGTTWLQPYGLRYDQDAVGDETGFTAESYGLALGVDWPALGADGVGVMFSWAGSRVENEAFSVDDLRADTLLGGVYGGWSWGPAFVDLTGMGGYSFYRRQRTVQFGSVTRRPLSDWDGYQYSGSARVGVDWAFGNIVVTPSGGIDYLWLKQNGYSEQNGGVGVNLLVEEQEAESLRASAGVEVSREFKIERSYFIPAVRLGYRHELETDPLSLTAGFRGDHDGVANNGELDSFSMFTLVGADQSETGFTGGLSIDMQRDDMQIGFDYDLLVEEDLLRHGFNMHLRFVF